MILSSPGTQGQHGECGGLSGGRLVPGVSQRGAQEGVGDGGPAAPYYCPGCLLR